MVALSRCLGSLALLLAGSEGARIARKRSAASAQCGAKGTSAAALGGPNASIVNGQPADECEWKWQVGLRRTASFGPLCGGMLIDPEWVLTAAHCLTGQTRVNVIAGEYHTSQSSGNEQSIWSTEIFMHPSYNGGTYEHDLGLIKLETPVEINACVGTVCLPQEDADVVPGTSCTITGWGALSSGGSSPQELQEAEVNVLSNEECKATGYSASRIKPSMLCAQGRNANGGITDACQGDSGGPLVCESGGVWTVYGATSWGSGCAGENYPGVWARVHEDLAWIQNTLIPPPPTPAPPPGTPTPAPRPGTWVLTGTGCEMDGNCIQSNNHPSNYGNDENCRVELYGDIPLAFDAFRTESGYDILTVGGVQYDGSNGPSNGAYTGTVTWQSDYSATQTGWKFCRTD